MEAKTWEETGVELREKLIQWITDYKDASERNALAETPEESAEYLLSLIGNLKQKERERISKMPCWLAQIHSEKCPIKENLKEA